VLIIVPELKSYILLREKGLHEDRMFFYRGYLQAFFIRLAGVVRWLFPMHSFLRGRLDTVADIIGI
jgi:hypothetical protein